MRGDSAFGMAPSLVLRAWSSQAADRRAGECSELEAIANWLLVHWVRKDMGMVCVTVCNLAAPFYPDVACLGATGRDGSLTWDALRGKYEGPRAARMSHVPRFVAAFFRRPLCAGAQAEA